MTAEPPEGQMSPANSTNPLESVLFEVKRTIVGQDVLLERMAIALLSGGHLLVEGVPGLAKTLAVKSLAAAVGGQFQRIQFTPDLVPADLTGTRVYHQHTGEFETQLGPVFANLLLADEINRAPAKVQSALLEVMQEHQVTIGRETFQVPEPFLVMATQNPIESEGTYPLPEAQVDRFMMKVLVSYPSSAEEHAIVERALRPAEPIRAMLTPADLTRMQERVQQLYVDPAITEYAVRLVTATRLPGLVGLDDTKRYLTYGASPRASIALVVGGRALAFLRGRDYVLPYDVSELAADVLRHRVVLSYEALADDVSADNIIARVLDAVPEPEVVLQGR
ncbi:MAG TPA: MoxR family ATPase [Streptosporangiaceae bacterium]|jgi:MoxR-like ATPase